MIVMGILIFFTALRKTSCLSITNVLLSGVMIWPLFILGQTSMLVYGTGAEFKLGVDTAVDQVDVPEVPKMAGNYAAK